jgi:hypothetical protein
MTTVFTLKDLVKYIIFIGIIYGLIIIIQSREISKINLILIVSIIYISSILLDCLNNNSESFSVPTGNAGSAVIPTNNVSAITAIAGNNQANVTWTVPANNSGSDISNYVIINNVNPNITTIVDALSFTTTTKTGQTLMSPISTATTTTLNGFTTITATVLGLTNCTPYTFTVLPQNQAGRSLVTSASISNLVIPILQTTTRPTNNVSQVTATAGNGQASVTWTIPANSSGSDISNYVIINNVDISINTIVDASTFLTTTKREQTIITPTSTAIRTTLNGFTTITATVRGLINGTPYTFTVLPQNQAGRPLVTSASISNLVIPTAIPINNVTAVTATAGNGQASVTWTVPAYNSGSDISNYVIINNVNPNITTIVDASSFITTTMTGQIISTATTTTLNGFTTITATVLGLTNGTPYTFTVLPQNQAGRPSPTTTSISTPVIPTAPTAIPTNNVTAVTATAGNGQASVTWTVPANNSGSDISNYIIINNVDISINTFVDASSFLTTTKTGQTPILPTSTATTTTLNGFTTITATVLGLTNGTPYTFTVLPQNQAGRSPPTTTSISTPVIPTAPTAIPINNITAVTAIAGNGQANVSWTIPTNNSGSDISNYIIINNVDISINTFVDASSFLTTTKIGQMIITPTSIATRTTQNNFTTITATVIGLTNGIPYTFTVLPQNQAGRSLVTSASISTPVTPTAATAIPINNVTAVTAIAGNGQANVTWTVPTNNSSSDISSYVIINNVDISINTIVDASTFLTTTKTGQTIITPTSIATTTTVNGLTTITATVLGLINGTSYTFTVLPQNQAGRSLTTSVSTSNSVTPTIENNIMLYVKIVGGIIAGIFLLYLVIMLFSNNKSDKVLVEEEEEEN